MNLVKLFYLRMVAVLLVAFLLLGCASSKTKTDPQDPGKISPIKQSKTIGLVLGGVGVSSFATVGLLKGLREEGIEIDFIVSTGWPALFSVGYGLMPSVHDLEWFATRLKPSDFYNERFLGKKGFSNHDRFSKRISRAFKKSSLNQSSTPLILTASNLRSLQPDVYTSGGWKSPLFKAVSAPAIFQPFPNRSSRQWITSLQGLDVNVAKKREPDIVVAVDMYEDYLRFIDKKPDSSEGVFRRIFVTELRDQLRIQKDQADLNYQLHLRKSPLDFSAKREAIHRGQRLAKEMASDLRSKLSD